jgi:hypothetical protein
MKRSLPRRPGHRKANGRSRGQTSLAWQSIRRTVLLWQERAAAGHGQPFRPEAITLVVEAKLMLPIENVARRLTAFT